MPEFHFCPKCGAKLTKQMREDRERLVCTGCSYVFYQNSKPCTAVLVEKDGRLMLTKRRFEPFRDWWDLPGGFVEEGEHPEDGAVRELKEETGMDIEIIDFLGVELDTYGEENISTLNFHYLTRPVGGTTVPGSDVSEIRWFSREEIPENVAFKNCRSAIEKWKKRKTGV